MNPASSAALAIILVAAAAADLRARRIPNALTFPGLALGLLLATWQAGWTGLAAGLLGLAAGAALLFLPFALGGIGAGDVKLLAVVGAFGGAAFAFRAFLAAALLGGLASALVLWRAGRLGATLRTALWDFASLVSPALPFVTLPKQAAEEERRGVPGALPYGVVIALGTLLAWVWQAAGGR